MDKILVVGAGVSGCVTARLSAEAGKAVVLVDRRPHIGGNAYDEKDENGITVQRYGPHIFHTNSKPVWDFLSRFTGWRHYQHRVLSFVHGALVPMPINIDTVNQLFNLSHTADTIESFYASRRISIEEPANLKEAVVSRVGEELYDLMFKNYTLKQWGMDGTGLPAFIAGRVSTRNTRDSRYFTDRYQGMPEHGYAAMFRAMLDHPNIELRLNRSYADLSEAEQALPTRYTGSMDEFFGYRFGRLPYRTLRFEFKTHDQEWFQPVAVVNYPNDYDFTRITEFKRWTGEQSPRTTVAYEYPADEGEPYYPVPVDEAQVLFRRYAAEAEKVGHVRFQGRLGNYRYMDIDQVVLEAMAACDFSVR